MTQGNGKYGYDERRTALMETARRVFLAQGYSTTTMEDVAAAHGGSKTTLYKYFPSKDALFNAIVEAQSKEIRQQLDVFSGRAGDFRMVLEGFCKCCLTISLSKDMVAFERMVIAEATHFPRAAQAAYDLGFKQALEYWEIIIREAIDAGQLRRVDARAATGYLLYLSEGSLKKMRLWGIVGNVGEDEIDYHAKIIVSIFLAAFGNDELAAEARKFTGRQDF